MTFYFDDKAACALERGGGDAFKNLCRSTLHNRWYGEISTILDYFMSNLENRFGGEFDFTATPIKWWFFDNRFGLNCEFNVLITHGDEMIMDFVAAVSGSGSWTFIFDKEGKDRLSSINLLVPAWSALVVEEFLLRANGRIGKVQSSSGNAI